mmetsp:Transcript_70707/g.127396  ORF Transcript_70707/g.127396 Transcript_70707/m.127396 type:complete len:96 (+) Transcript_70707:3-290(+)
MRDDLIDEIAILLRQFPDEQLLALAAELRCKLRAASFEISVRMAATGELLGEAQLLQSSARVSALCDAISLTEDMQERPGGSIPGLWTRVGQNSV